MVTWRSRQGVRLRSHSEPEWPESDLFPSICDPDLICLLAVWTELHGIWSSQIRFGLLSYLVLIQILIRFFDMWPQTQGDFYITLNNLLINQFIIAAKPQTKTNTVAKSSPRHPEILDEICFPEAIHITIPPQPGLTPHPHTPLHRHSSHYTLFLSLFLSYKFLVHRSPASITQ